MMRISIIFFTVVSAVVMGSFMVIALVMGFDTAKPVMMAVGLAFLQQCPLLGCLRKSFTGCAHLIKAKLLLFLKCLHWRFNELAILGANLGSFWRGHC